MQHVRHHMYARVVPLYELAITPDIIRNLWCFYVFRLTVFREHIGHAPSGDTKGKRTLHRQLSTIQTRSSRVMKLSALFVCPQPLFKIAQYRKRSLDCKARLIQPKPLAYHHKARTFPEENIASMVSVL